MEDRKRPRHAPPASSAETGAGSGSGGRSVLVLGGNGMMGGDTVWELAQAGHTITTVNRGREHWDSATRLEGCVHRRVICDRDKLVCKRAPKAWPGELAEDERFDFVVDFSSYSRKDIRSALQHFGGSVGTYIYISSDSVYEVSRPPTNTSFRKGVTRSVEADAGRPQSDELRRKLRRKDRYGHGKLAGEEEITAAAAKAGFDFTFLRLADVFGARDLTDRWAGYVVWIFGCCDHGVAIELPGGPVEQELSFVHCKDVAAMVARIVGGGIPSEQLNTAYNLAFPVTVTLKALLELMAATLRVGPLKFDVIPTTSDTKADAFFPSVERGPVDVSRAVQSLGWDPDPLAVAMLPVCQFYVTMLLDKHPDAMDPVEEFLKDHFPAGGTPDAYLDRLRPRLAASLAAMSNR